MSPSAQVQSIQALDDLKGALGRFAGESQEALQAAEQEIRRTLDWLQERLNHWQNEVRRRQEEVRRAEVALARCQASGYYDREGHYHAPDCSAYEHALRQAQIRLQEAESELRSVQQWMKVVGEAVAAYRTQAQRLGQLLATDLPKAEAFLQHKIADLHAYLVVTPPPSFQPVEGTAQAVDQGSMVVGREEPERLKSGKIYHKKVQADWRKNAKDVEAGKEVEEEKEIIKPSGRKGRIDVFVPVDESLVAVVEVKASDWDTINIHENIRRQARQIWDYIESQRKLGKDVSPGVIFPERPKDPERVKLIEQLFDEEGIAVVWEDESIAEHKARS